MTSSVANKHRDAIIAAITASRTRGLGRAEIAAKLGMSPRNVSYLLKLLRAEGSIVVSGGGGCARLFLTQAEADLYHLRGEKTVEEKRRLNTQRNARYRAARRAALPGREQVESPAKGVAAPVRVFNSRAFRDAPAVTPDHVQVQRLPGFAVRGRFEPEPDHVGEFTAAWREKRELEPA